jgi:hypothetical protein
MWLKPLLYLILALAIVLVCSVEIFPDQDTPTETLPQ